MREKTAEATDELDYPASYAGPQQSFDIPHSVAALREPRMSCNSIQMQKGLSLTAFLERYGTEPKCEAAVHAWR